MKIRPNALAAEIVRTAEQIPAKDLPALMDKVAGILEQRGERRLLRQLPYYVEKAYLKHHGITPVTVTSPGKEFAAGTELSEALTKAIKGKVELSEETDPSLIGGVRLTIGDDRFDFSLVTALQEAARSLSTPL